MARKRMVVVDSEKIEWETVEHALERLARGDEVTRAPEVVKRAWVKVLNYDEETGAVALLCKFDKGFHESKHAHASDNCFTVLEGKGVVLEGNEIKRGTYIFTPAGVEHGPLEAPEGCVLFAYFNGPAW
jgi:quercetin dioxygenase-like cupin family protein